MKRLIVASAVCALLLYGSLFVLASMMTDAIQERGLKTIVNEIWEGEK